MARNTLKCKMTGAERITNNSYLGKRLERLGIDEEEFRRHYISKICAQNLADAVEADGLETVAHSLTGTRGYAYTVEDVHKMLLYNGKNKLVLAQALKQLDTSDDSTSKGEHEFVPLTVSTDCDTSTDTSSCCGGSCH